jgi:hypothetical protein
VPGACLAVRCRLPTVRRSSSAKTGSGTGIDRQSENAPKSLAVSDGASPSRRRGLGRFSSVVASRRTSFFRAIPRFPWTILFDPIEAGRFGWHVGPRQAGETFGPIRGGVERPAPSALAVSKSAHKHHVPRMMRFDLPSQSLDRRGTTPTQRNKENLISVQVDDIIQA